MNLYYNKLEYFKCTVYADTTYMAEWKGKNE